MKCARVGCSREFTPRTKQKRYCCELCQKRSVCDRYRERYAILKQAGYSPRDASDGRRSQAEFETMLSVPA